ncbi:unnamed protein product [Clavelina lepadiformis]|uniref:G-protein coupled receptors family 1 profile domain-containing protein n=1 Tax=Clavelina lepadiformis TaxID=159417 RepID=A0ABP0FKK4_CLALP
MRSDFLMNCFLLFTATSCFEIAEKPGNCVLPIDGNDNKSMFLVSDFCGKNASEVNDENKRASTLDYLSWLKNIGDNKSCHSNFRINNLLKKECREMKFGLSVYHKVISSQICGKYDADILPRNCPSKPNHNQLFGEIYEQNISYPCRLYLFVQNFIQCRRQLHVTGSIQRNHSDVRYIFYKEKIYEDIPFCFPFVCPYYESSDLEEKLSSTLIGKTLFDCMPSSCQLAHYVIAVVDAFMAFLTVVVNSLILVVAVRTKHFSCSHGYFIVSLAIADLIVGLITEPLMVYSHLRQSKLLFAEADLHNDWYCIVAGFFTNVPLCASLLALIGSSGFRYVVISKPVSYWNHRGGMKKHALHITIAIWIFSSIFGLIPVLAPSDRYRIHFVGMTLSVKMDEFYIYHMTLTTGLVSLWILTILLRLKLKRYGKQRLRQMTRKYSLRTTKENSFQTTRETAVCDFLRVIVTVFTICYLPLVITQSFARLQSIDLKKLPESFDVMSNYAWNVCMFLSSRFVLGNSFANFFIYLIKDKGFKKALFTATSLGKLR